MTSVETRSRDRLLAAATTLFYERGFLATSVKEITQACGFTQGALYNHFSSKDELLYELVLDIHAELERHTIRERANAGDDPVDQFAALVAVHVTAHCQFRERSRVGNHEYRYLTSSRLVGVLDIRRRLRDQLAEVLAAGAAAGAFHLVSGSATGTARAVLDMCGLISEWFRDDGELTPLAMHRRYVELALRMAGGPPEPPHWPVLPEPPQFPGVDDA
ncbi:TetR/AcrR family transcriptional regulator [Kutzneria buriramensis]|uniref:AcrR family transcriptional regulator n=1 Tax=Kutzneria buriramensis TaxID=1045776 RepID=A0A3E0I9D5_9PSEU|nr:TetR/AcrR family transcriptional regulator [Kutzneria buriramensis]REH55354.1 AcrR family transcriptional regulator [Kutzneria buriramensis]